MKFAYIKGHWFCGYTGTRQFIPEKVFLFQTEDEASSFLAKDYKESGNYGYITPVAKPTLQCR